MNSLNVDPEPKRTRVTKTLQIQENILIVYVLNSVTLLTFSSIIIFVTNLKLHFPCRRLLG